MKTNLDKEVTELSAMELNGSFHATESKRTQAAKFLGKLGGKKSAQSRLGGKTNEEISEAMRLLRFNKRYTKKEQKELNEMAEDAVQALNAGVARNERLHD